MGKGWGNRGKGRSKNKQQRDTTDAAAAAAELAGLAAKRKRSSHDAGDSSPKCRKHVPQKVGRGGAREKLDVNELDSPSRRQVERNRRNVAAHRLRNKSGGYVQVSEDVLADPTEAWRTKASGRTNKYPDRARQRAAADHTTGVTTWRYRRCVCVCAMDARSGAVILLLVWEDHTDRPASHSMLEDLSSWVVQSLAVQLPSSTGVDADLVTWHLRRLAAVHDMCWGGVVGGGRKRDVLL